MTTHSWEEYFQSFDQILAGNFTNHLYENEAYRDYVKMNLSRVSRWLKHGELNPDLVQIIEQINENQTWYLITEPWCGDAAHSTPFIARLAELNPHISLKIVLRDENLDFIDQYLTNGGRSIPKLIVRNEQHEDIIVWGPRPQVLASIYSELKANDEPFENISKVLQNWYNHDKGVLIQSELLNLFQLID